MRTLSLAALLLATAFVPLAGAADTSADLCVNYMYVADYQWYYACVDPKGGTCAVYTYRSNGVWNSEPDCVLRKSSSTETWDGCVFLAQDLDYSHYVCVAPRDPSCAVYTKRVSGGHEVRNCVGVPLATSQPEAWCIPTSGGLDYHSYLCVDAGNLKCPAYQTWSNDWGTYKQCYPPTLA